MRISLYAPLLGLCAAAALAQTPPGAHNNTNQKPASSWMTSSMPVVPEPRMGPLLTCELCAKAVPQREKYGTNRAAIERAIRGLTSRIFPGMRLTSGRQPGASSTAFHPRAGFQVLDKR